MLTFAWMPRVGGRKQDEIPNPTIEVPTAFCRVVFGRGGCKVGGIRRPPRLAERDQKDGRADQQDHCCDPAGIVERSGPGRVGVPAAAQPAAPPPESTKTASPITTSTAGQMKLLDG